MVESVKNRLGKPSDKTLVNIERAAWAGLGVLGVAGAIQLGSMIDGGRPSQPEAATRPAGAPENVIEVGSAGAPSTTLEAQEGRGAGDSQLDADWIVAQMEPARQSPPVQGAEQGVVDQGPGTADAQSQPQEAAQQEQQVEVLDQSRVARVLESLRARGFEVGQEEDTGII